MPRRKRRASVELNDETAARCRTFRNDHVTTHRSSQAAADREAQSGPWRRARFQPDERLEDRLARLRRDALSTVGDVEIHVVLIGSTSEMDDAVRWSELHGIAQQVQQHLPQ